MDRWQEISRIVQAALAQEPRARDAFLVDACAGDHDLRRQVEFLLASADETKIAEGPSTSASPPHTGSPTAPVASASGRLAHYRIVKLLGTGGMGEVYRARDEQLDREVAVKVLPASSFDDPAARARLVREARAAAALNHPNICTVHEVGEANGQAYIAMELVEGQTLAARLAGGPLPVDQALTTGDSSPTP